MIPLVEIKRCSGSIVVETTTTTLDVKMQHVGGAITEIKNSSRTVWIGPLGYNPIPRRVGASGIHPRFSSNSTG